MKQSLQTTAMVNGMIIFTLYANDVFDIGFSSVNTTTYDIHSHIFVEPIAGNVKTSLDECTH